MPFGGGKVEILFIIGSNKKITFQVMKNNAETILKDMACKRSRV